MLGPDWAVAFAIIRATSLCLRGSRVKWRSGFGMDDGAPFYSILLLMHMDNGRIYFIVNSCLCIVSIISLEETCYNEQLLRSTSRRVT